MENDKQVENSAEQENETTVSSETINDINNLDQVAETEEENTEASSRAEGEVDEIESLKSSLKAALEKSEANWQQLLLARAEVENVKRRAKKDIENAHKYGLEEFAKELLPVKDSMELALQSAENSNDNNEKLKEGIQLTLKMFGSLFEKIKVSEINPVNEKFNPEFHQAMATEPSADHDPNTVLKVFQKGYAISGRLIRPAMVVVSAKIDEGEPKTHKKIDEIA